MELKKLYTAVGRLEREANGCGHSCPVIVLGGERYMVDMQEMVVWTALNWRISKWDDISCQCDKLASSLGGCVARPWDACVNRLLIRGLLVSGCGETEFIVRPAQLSWGHPHQWLRICTRRVRFQAGTQPADNDEAGYEAIP